jgi:hypothetical protein
VIDREMEIRNASCRNWRIFKRLNFLLHESLDLAGLEMKASEASFSSDHRYSSGKTISSW